MAVSADTLGKILLEKSLITDKNLESIKHRALSLDISLEEALYESDSVNHAQLAQIIADLYGVPLVNIAEKIIPEHLLPLVPYRLASYQYLIPFEQTDNEMHVAMNNPQNHELINFLENKTGLNIKVFYSTKEDIKKALKVYNKDINQKFAKLLDKKIESTRNETLTDASKIVDSIILFAFQNNSSDIHIEPHANFIIVRCRIDGILTSIIELPIEIADLITTRIKVLAKLRTDEHRAAQDGRFKIELEKNEITMRVSIVPVYDGEKIVMRILASSMQDLNLTSLGYTKRNLDVINNNILKTHGIILMTGPTGSGKTTTLYTILKLLNSPEVNISTIEDPIEYRLEGINQIQVNPKADLTFANGLRALLRQDPDIVMIGEIRDEETASIAINAALTGHLVLATLHTNDAATTLPRMLEMGVASFLLAATAKLVIAQRLVRKICDNCKKPYTITKDELDNFAKKFNLKEDVTKVLFETRGAGDSNSFELYKGEGCNICHGSGYKGRTAISELMEVTDEVQKLILNNKTPKEIEATAKQEGMTTIFMDGMAKALSGMTSIEEVLRVMRS